MIGRATSEGSLARRRGGGYDASVRFTKMHGLGNDYIYVDTSVEVLANPPQVARAVSDRHTGIGSDGLILIASSQVADVRMEMYNADGSRGKMCGNGIRCVAKYAFEHGLAKGPRMRIETDSGIKDAKCNLTEGKVRSVWVDMGPPELDAAKIPTTLTAGRVVDHPLRIGGVDYRVTCVSMGNPHAVVFVEELQRIDLVEVGPEFEHADVFPRRINTHFVRVDSPTRVTVRTWELGSGATRACGTGACAVCVAGVMTKRTERAITAALPGGELQIEWAADDHAHMTGPAVEVFHGQWFP